MYETALALQIKAHFYSKDDKKQKNQPLFGFGQATTKILVSFLRPSSQSFGILSAWLGLSLDAKLAADLKLSGVVAHGDKRSLLRMEEATPFPFLSPNTAGLRLPQVSLSESWDQACHL